VLVVPLVPLEGPVPKENAERLAKRVLRVSEDGQESLARRVSRVRWVRSASEALAEPRVPLAEAATKGSLAPLGLEVLPELAATEVILGSVEKKAALAETVQWATPGRPATQAAPALWATAANAAPRVEPGERGFRAMLGSPVLPGSAASQVAAEPRAAVGPQGALDGVAPAVPLVLQASQASLANQASQVLAAALAQPVVLARLGLVATVATQARADCAAVVGLRVLQAASPRGASAQAATVASSAVSGQSSARSAAATSVLESFAGLLADGASVAGVGAKPRVTPGVAVCGICAA